MQGLQHDAGRLIWQGNGETLQIEPWGRDSVRVRACIGPAVSSGVVEALLPQAATGATITVGDEGATLRNGALTVEVSRDGLVRFIETAGGRELLAEEPPTRATRIRARSFLAVQGNLFHLEARFGSYAGERFYGLGQHQHGHLNQKGCVVDLIQRNTEVTIPFVLSTRGYGLLWHNPAVGRVELGDTLTRWVAEATPQLDYWFTTGATPADIMERYADATGHTPNFPDWAAGFWQCKLRYRTQEELLSVAREYKRRGLPLSVIVADFFHWTLQGDWRFDPELWPDPAAMVRELDDMGVKLMVSVWPTVNALSENFEEMQRRGLLIGTERGIPVLHVFEDNKPKGPIGIYYYDATNPEARKFLWDQVREHYYSIGIKVFWIDACEPEAFPMHPDNMRFHIGNGLAVSTAYPMLHESAFYDGLTAAGETAILNLCRSAWAGSQRFGAAVWSGDIVSSFEVFQAQVRAGLNIGMSGIPWWTTDIGGFYGGDPDSAEFRELLVRWFQYAAFCPLFRLHGYRTMHGTEGHMLSTGGPNEAWSYGDDVYEIIKDLLFLRERLRPYVMTQMQVAKEKGTPPMRPLFFDYPNDEGCAAIDDQFLFGPDILVAPILQAGQRSRTVYLPAGIAWVDAWNGQTLQGGQRVTADAPLQRIPVYLRHGAELDIKGDAAVK
jgi:alpha-D-xyloside xylohydrolase